MLERLCRVVSMPPSLPPSADMDSSDEEFVVAAEDQRRAEQSDHCSDFSDDDNSPRELPEDSTNQLADEGRDTDSDDDDINIISRTAKKKNAAFRRLDSDDEDSTLPEKTVSTHTATEEGRPPFALFGSSSSSSSKTSKVGEHIVAVKRDGASRRFSVLAEEASMGPLLLNDSFSEESEASTSERASPDPPLFKKPGLLPAESGLATLQHEDTCMTMFDSAFPQGADGGTAKTTFTLTESSGLATVQLRDSGLATQETPDQHYDPLPDTLPMEEEEEEEEDTGYLGGGGDDSLESNSIQCGQTTTTAAIPQPPPRKDSSDLFSSSVSTTRKVGDTHTHTHTHIHTHTLDAAFPCGRRAMSWSHNGCRLTGPAPSRLSRWMRKHSSSMPTGTPVVVVSKFPLFK